MTDTHAYLWAKQHGTDKPYPLLAHMLDTATMALVLHDHWLRQGLRDMFAEHLGAKSRGITAYIAGTHDIGKASIVFQYQAKQRGEIWDCIRESIAEAMLGAFACLDYDEDDNILAISQNTNAKYLRRHEQYSAILLGAVDAEWQSSNKTAKSWRFLPALGHHGRFSVPFAIDTENGGYDHDDFCDAHSDNGWSTAQNDLLQLMREATGITDADLPENVPPKISILLSGLTVLADRLASHENWVRQQQDRLESGEVSLANPGEWIAKSYDAALVHAHETVGIYHPWESAHAAKQAILGDFEPRPLQAQALAAADGLWNVMVQTGGGKTEAALLRHSTANERLIFLLPTQATTNAIMRRVQKAYQGTENVASLAHGLASIEDFYTREVTAFDSGATSTAETSDDSCVGKAASGLYPTEFVKSGAARLLAPVCVGTVDQALMGALPLKWTHLRLLALANAHTVLDEVHTLDQYQSKLLIPLLRWWGATGTRVTLLTATLPAWQRKEFLDAYSAGESGNMADMPEVHFPSLENISPNRSVHTVTHLTGESYTIDFSLVKTEKYDIENNHIEWAKQARQDFPKARLGIICNTVSRAQQVALQLSEIGEKVILLHSRMTAEHRRRNAEKLEAEIGAGKTGDRLTVVGTQAIEASLDIDLDMLSTDICPAPSLIQRAGRVWRRADPGRANRIPGVPNIPIRIVVPTAISKYATMPYLPAELKKVSEFLENNQNFTVPADNQRFIDDTTVTLDNIDPDDPDMLDAVSEHIRKAQKGTQSAHKMQHVLHPKGRISDFMALTGGAAEMTEEVGEMRTRLIEQETRQVIICGDPAIIPGAWPGTASELLAVRPSDQNKIRQALKASMPVPGNRLAAELRSLEGANSLLQRYFVLENGAQYYDPIIGFNTHAINAETGRAEGK